jgi:hypothetical protein
MPSPNENSRLQHLAATGEATRLILAVNPRWPLHSSGGDNATEAVFTLTQYDLPHLRLSVLRAYPSPWKVFVTPHGGASELLATGTARPSLRDLVSLLCGRQPQRQVGLHRSSGPSIDWSGPSPMESQSCNLEAMHACMSGDVKAQSCNLELMHACQMPEEESPNWAGELLAAASEIGIPAAQPQQHFHLKRTSVGGTFSSVPDLTRMAALYDCREAGAPASPSQMWPAASAHTFPGQHGGLSTSDLLSGPLPARETDDKQWELAGELEFLW